MKCFFNLVNGQDIIKDNDGLDVDNVDEARTQALKAIDELLSEEDTSSEDWNGWHLEVTDASGTVLFRIALGRTFH